MALKHYLVKMHFNCKQNMTYTQGSELLGGMGGAQVWNRDINGTFAELSRILYKSIHRFPKNATHA